MTSIKLEHPFGTERPHSDVGIAGGPRQSIARRLVGSALGGMTRGRLEMQLPEGATVAFGDPRALDLSLPLDIASTARLQVVHESFFRRSVLSGDIGFAESYIDGDWDSDDLTAVIAWFVLNVDRAPTLSGSSARGSALAGAGRIANRVRHLLRRNSEKVARRNISEHYDLSNDFFSLFLDPAMMYSSGLWSRAATTLAESQREKNEALCQALRLQPTDHVLEIGSGWGGWAIQAARDYGCRVTSITISEQQRLLARERVAAAGLSDRVDVQFLDFRRVEGAFDKIVSIEMMEALGHEYHEAFCATVARVLVPDGIAALQFITCADSRYQELRRGVDFIQRHIFPGSLLLSTNRVSDLLAKAGGFVLHDLRDMGLDYARTLRAWRQAFDEREGDVRSQGFDDRFIRKWRYYLSYCEAAFALRNVSVVQAVYTRPNNHSLESWRRT
ncbi:cyclopropane-fatty-acyl-phospholipid synthase family protein [soil metagenome]